jgi:hypothetical protein
MTTTAERTAQNDKWFRTVRTVLNLTSRICRDDPYTSTRHPVGLMRPLAPSLALVPIAQRDDGRHMS